MLKLFQYSEDFGRMGTLEGIFVAKESEVAKIMGKEVYFGEILGKHSEITTEIIPENIKIVSEDQAFIKKLCEIFKTRSISGINPLEFLED
ncbi:MAG: hypothetical protein WC503_01105 [Candidatus Shapirobacteria bacterium]